MSVAGIDALFVMTTGPWNFAAGVVRRITIDSILSAKQKYVDI